MLCPYLYQIFANFSDHFLIKIQSYAYLKLYTIHCQKHFTKRVPTKTSTMCGSFHSRKPWIISFLKIILSGITLNVFVNCFQMEVILQNLYLSYYLWGWTFYMCIKICGFPFVFFAHVLIWEYLSFTYWFPRFF